MRKLLLGASATVNCEIPLTRYSFYKAVEDKLLPRGGWQRPLILPLFGFP